MLARNSDLILLASRASLRAKSSSMFWISMVSRFCRTSSVAWSMLCCISSWALCSVSAMRLMPEASSSSSLLPIGGRRVSMRPSLSWATPWLISSSGALIARLMRRARRAVTPRPAAISKRLVNRLRYPRSRVPWCDSSSSTQPSTRSSSGSVAPDRLWWRPRTGSRKCVVSSSVDMLRWLASPAGATVSMLGPAWARRSWRASRKVTARTSGWSSASLAMRLSTAVSFRASAVAASGASCSAISCPRSINWARMSDSWTQVK